MWTSLQCKKRDVSVHFAELSGSTEGEKTFADSTESSVLSEVVRLVHWPLCSSQCQYEMKHLFPMPPLSSVVLIM